MSKILVLFMILCVSLFGNSNPRLYALLGDKLFDATARLEPFKSVDTLTMRIDEYQTQSGLVLHEGLALESSGTISSEDKKQYLRSLRDLEKYYSNIVGSLQQELLKSIKTSDYDSFKMICNSGIEDLFDDSTVQQQAITFYQANKSEGMIESIEQLQKERMQKKQFQAMRKSNPSRTSETKSSAKKRFTMDIQSYKDNSIEPYKMKFGITLEECKALCLKDSRCQSMIMNMKTQKCWFKESVGHVFESRNGILGIKKAL